MKINTNTSRGIKKYIIKIDENLTLTIQTVYLHNIN